VAAVSWEDHAAADSCKIIILVEDTLPSQATELEAKHGLSLLVETVSDGETSKILMDAGPSPEIIAHNRRTLNARLDDLDIVVLSHGHYDHTDGLLEALKFTDTPPPAIIHPKTFCPKFAYKPTLTYIGSHVTHQSVEAAGGVLVPTPSPLPIAKGAIASGEIPLETSFEKAKGFWKVENGGFVEDLMVDEQALIIDLRRKGLVIITGCAHRGIVNTVRLAQRIMKNDKVHAIAGGFHLSKADINVIDATIRELDAIAPDAIYPCHCSGGKAVAKLAAAFGRRCRQIHTGDVITL